MIEIDIDGPIFTAELHDDRLPQSVTAVREFLPFESELMHVRWSSIATWINIGEIELPELPRKNYMVYPFHGDLPLFLYPGTGMNGRFSCPVVPRVSRAQLADSSVIALRA